MPCCTGNRLCSPGVISEGVVMDNDWPTKKQLEQAREKLDQADKPDTVFTGNAYRNLRDMALSDWADEFAVTLRAALDLAIAQADRPADVEALKRDHADELYVGDQVKVWNDCIDHLAIIDALRIPATGLALDGNKNKR